MRSAASRERSGGAPGRPEASRSAQEQRRLRDAGGELRPVDEELSLDHLLDVLRPTTRLHGPVRPHPHVGPEVLLDVGVPAALGEVRHRFDEREIVVPRRVDALEAVERGLDLVDHRRVELRGRIDRDAAFDPIGMVRGEPVGQQPAERVADDHDALEPERVEEPEHVAAVILDRVPRRRRVALAAAAHVERENVGHVRQPRVDEPVEGVGVRGEAGKEHERGAVATVVEVVQPDPVRLDEAVAHDRASSLATISRSSRRSVFPAAFRGNSSSTMTLESFWKRASTLSFTHSLISSAPAVSPSRSVTAATGVSPH